MPMLPEEKARVKIDKQLRNAGWDIVARNLKRSMILKLIISRR